MKRKNHRIAQNRVKTLLTRAIPLQLFETLESRQLLSATYSVASLPGNPIGQAGAFNDAGQVAGSNGDVGFLYSNGATTTFSANNNANLTVTGMNASGQIVGTAGDAAFLYSLGTVTLLTTPSGTVSATPVAINNSGTIAGTYSPQANVLHGFVYSNGLFTDIGTLGGTGSTITGLNSSGQAVGYSNVANGDTHAFLYSGGTITDIDSTNGNYSTATAINDAGQIIGSDRTSAFLYSGGTLTHLSFAAGDVTQADVINASGEVAGIAVDASSNDELFTYLNGVIKDAGKIPGSGLTVTGINSAGAVIGNSTNATSFATSPFVYENGSIQTFNYDQASINPVQEEVGTASAPLQDADFINASGQVVADVPDDFDGGQFDVYVLTPSSSGSISGTVFEDTNADGQQQSGESGLAGLTVYDDETNSDFPMLGDPQTTTDANGNYTLTDIPPGPAIIRFAATTSNTTQSVQSFTLASGQNATNINFATHPIIHFQVTDLGQLGGFDTTATAINNSGQIAGYAFDGTNYHPFLYTVSTGKYTDLTSVLGANVEINSINDNGVMVGAKITGNVDSIEQPLTSAFVYSNGVMTILPLPAGTDSASAVGVNDQGQVVALAYSVPTANGPYTFDYTYGYVYSATTGQIVTQIPQGDTNIGALAINNSGQIFENAYELPHLAEPGTGENFLDTKGVLAPLTGSTSASGPWFGNPVPGTLADTIVAYNNLGGNPFSSGPFGVDDDLPTSFYTGTQNLDLNAALPAGSQWSLVTADAINSTDMIVGSGINPQGKIDAYLLTPATVAPPVSLSGTVFNDTNKDGIQDNGETGVAGVTVYEDPNYNHKVDATEQHVVTDSNGNFTFTNLPADPEILRVVLPSGYTQILPANGAGIYVGSNVTQSLTGLNFGIFTPTVVQPATVSGTVFNDLNEDGVQQQGEGGVSGVMVYVDLNNTGSFIVGDPTSTTDSLGNYTITDIPPGNYTVREIVPSGDEQFMPSAGTDYPVSLTSGQAVTGLNFAVIVPKFPPTEDISGTVFNDLNHDGIQDNGELGVAGVVVYQDPNYNHKIDSTEQFTITDALGHYDFNDPPADPEILRIILPNGTTQSLPTGGVGIYVGQNTGQTLANENFAIVAATGPATATVTGAVYTDANADGVQDNGETGVSGVSVYVDLYKTGNYVSGDPTSITDANGNYSIAGLAPGSYTVREVVPAGSTQTTPSAAAGISVSLAAGQTLANTSFGLNAPTVAQTGSISGTVFNDTNHDGIQDNGETGIAGVTVYEDPNYNHKVDATEQHVVTDANGNYTFTNLPADPEIIRIVLPSSATQTAPANGVGVYVGKNITTAVTGVNFGISLPATGGTGTITGNVFNDLNGDHVQDGAELARVGAKVYLDLNHSGVFNAADPVATSDANGNYFFTGLAPGSYTVGLITDTGYRQTFPLTGGINVTVAAGGTVSAAFGETNTAYVGGTLFNDKNGNGIQDAGEAGLAGWTVYLDLNNDGIRESNEPVAQTVTTSTGYWYFRAVPVGTYAIRAVAPSGWTITHAYTVTLSSGQTVINGAIGAKQT